MSGALIALGLVATAALEPSKAAATLETAEPIRFAAVCMQGQMVVGAGMDKAMHVWRLPATTPSRIEVPSRISAIACSSDGRLIAASFGSGRDLKVRLFDAASGASRHELAIAPLGSIGGLEFSPDGSRLAVATHTVTQLWDTARGERTGELRTAFGGSNGLAFSPDGKRVASADADTWLRIHDLAGSSPREIDAGPLEPFAVVYLARGARLAMAGANRRITLIDAVSGKTLRESTPQADPIFQLAALPDGKTVAQLQLDEITLEPKALQLWDSESGVFRVLDVPAGDVVGAGASADGLVVVLKGADKTRLRVVTAR